MINNSFHSHALSLSTNAAQAAEFLQQIVTCQLSCLPLMPAPPTTDILLF